MRFMRLFGVFFYFIIVVLENGKDFYYYFVIVVVKWCIYRDIVRFNQDKILLDILVIFEDGKK